MSDVFEGAQNRTAPLTGATPSVGVEVDGFTWAFPVRAFDGVDHLLLPQPLAYQFRLAFRVTADLRALPTIRHRDYSKSEGFMTLDTFCSVWIPAGVFLDFLRASIEAGKTLNDDLLHPVCRAVALACAQVAKRPSVLEELARPTPTVVTPAVKSLPEPARKPLSKPGARPATRALRPRR